MFAEIFQRHKTVNEVRASNFLAGWGGEFLATPLSSLSGLDQVRHNHKSYLGHV